MSRTNLTDITPELIQRLDSKGGRNENQIVDDYFVELAKMDEMDGIISQPGHYCALKDIVKRDILPLINQYEAKTMAIELRKDNRKVSRYIIGTILAIEALEAIITRGKSLVPQIMIPSVLLESLLGAGIYGLTNLKDNSALKREEKKLLSGVNGLDKMIQVDQKYESFRQVSGKDKALLAESLEVISKYNDADSFWKDFSKIRSNDPTTEKEIGLLDSPAFKPFLTPHVKGDYNDQARRHRFEGLFIIAQQSFTKKLGPKYIERQLESFVEGERI